MNVRIIKGDPAEAMSGAFHRMDFKKDDVGVVVIHQPGVSLADIAFTLLKAEGIEIAKAAKDYPHELLQP